MLMGECIMVKLFNKFRLSKLHIFCLVCLYNSSVFAENKYKFDASFLKNSNEDEISLDFIDRHIIPPGIYVFDIYINNEYKKTASVNFYNTGDDSKGTAPCLDENLLLSLGINENVFNKKVDNCLDENILKRWTYKYDVYQQTLYLDIPETDLDKIVDGVAPKSVWDDGITAAFLSYNSNISTIKNKFNHNERNRAYFDIKPGFNLGEWRFRNRTYYDYSNDKKSQWRNISNYAERGIKELDSKITIGDFITSSEIFNGINLRGVTLSTDEAMIPARLSSNSPVIRATAKTQAFVEVEYNGYIIYSTTVDAGVFEIKDLPYMGSNGIYKLIINESDGSRNIITIPFNQAPIALKEGFSKYDINIGRYRLTESKETGPEILQGSYVYGLRNNVTIYTGFQYSNIYESYIAGVSLGLGYLGSVSFDSTFANAKIKNQHGTIEDNNGSSISLKYAKDFYSTGTNISLINNTYNSKYYKTLNESYESYESYDLGLGEPTNRRNLTTIRIQQSLNEYSGFNLSYNYEQYWDGSNYQYIDLNYNANFKGVNYSIGYNEYKNDNYKTNRMLTASIRIPFWFDNNRVSTNYKFSNGSSGSKTHNLGLSGSALNNSLSWNINQKYNNNTYYGASGNGTLRHQYGTFGIGASTDRYNNAYNATIGGGMLLSKHGLTFGHEISDSAAVIVAPGASNLDVSGKIGVRTNSRGYALVTGLQPYRENTISLNPLNMPDDVEILQTDIKVVPTSGAIVESSYKTSQGRKSIVKIMRSTNKNVPFGSVVSLRNKNDTAGIVGENGEVFLSGMPESGVIDVKWGIKDNESCIVKFDNISDIANKTLTCY